MEAAVVAEGAEDRGEPVILDVVVVVLPELELDPEFDTIEIPLTT
jgi:hypothetical protein